MNQTLLRRLVSLTLAVLLCSTAGAADTEQVLLSGDKVKPDQVEFSQLDGVPTATKTFTLRPEENPEILREEPFAHDGYKYVYDHMEKTKQEKEDKKDAEDTVTIDTSSSRLENVISQFPSTREYSKDGYSGTLTLDTESINIKATDFDTVTDSYPHKVTKTYELDYNDRSLVPETVESDGLTLPLVSLDWTEGKATPGSDIPSGWTATAVYSKTTYSSRNVTTGYQATAKYRGQVTKTNVDSIRYVVTYIGSEIPITPPLPVKRDGQAGAEFTDSKVFIVLLVILLIVFMMYVIRLLNQRYIAQAYVYNDGSVAPCSSSRHFVSLRNPVIKLPSYPEGEHTECIVIFHRRLARKLVGRKILLKSYIGNRVYTVRPFKGDKYLLRADLYKKPKPVRPQSLLLE